MNYFEEFQSIQSKKILVVGDVMVDAYIWGSVDRISPEAPVPVVNTTNTENRLGGAANVVKNLAALGLTPILCSVIGSDAAGDILAQTLENQNITSKYCIVSDTRKTTIKTRVLSGNHQILRIDNEQTNFLSPQLTAQLQQVIEDIICNQSIAAIVLQDYDKGVITPEILDFISTEAAKKSIPILVDPKKRNFWEFKNCTIFKPNFKEFTEGIGKTCDKEDLAHLHEISKSFMKSQGIENIMITLSEHGIFIANAHEYFHIPSQVRHVADVSGAGDTVISTAVACYIAGMSLYEIARISNIAGGLACEQPGVVTIDKEQLLKYI